MNLLNNLRLEVPRYGVIEGLPGEAVTITNTDRSKLPCKLKFWFSVIQHLRPIRTPGRLAYGNAWHLFLEAKNTWLMERDSVIPDDFETKCSWCRGAGCEHCLGSGEGPLQRVIRMWNEDVRENRMLVDDRDRMIETLQRAIDGYFHVNGRSPMPDWKVIAVEVKVAAPIRTPAGSLYTPRTFIVPTKDGFRLAKTGEAAMAQEVHWPMFQAMTLDAVIQNRSTGDLMVWEAKSSSSPTHYIRGVMVDPQVIGYCWGLEQALGKPGPFRHIDPARKVLGYMFDVASNQLQSDAKVLKPVKVPMLDQDGNPVMKGRSKVYQTDRDGQPILKSPGLSVAKNTNCPSWRFRRAIAENGFDPAEYADHLLHLSMTVDPKLYETIIGTYDHELRSRYTAEIYGIARDISTLRQRAAMSEISQISSEFPRTPICRMPGGTCDFRSICLAYGNESLMDFEIGDSQEWKRPESDTESGTSYPEIDW